MLDWPLPCWNAIVGKFVTTGHSSDHKVADFHRIARRSAWRMLWFFKNSPDQNRGLISLGDKEMNSTRRLLTSALLASAAAMAFSVPSTSHAEQFVAKYQGREVVVHTNPVPVVLHRLVPPNVGRHVSINEYRHVRKAPTITRNGR